MLIWLKYIDKSKKRNWMKNRFIQKKIKKEKHLMSRFGSLIKKYSAAEKKLAAENVKGEEEYIILKWKVIKSWEK